LVRTGRRCHQPGHRIADANSDSTPIVAITDNVSSHLLVKNAFQEVDVVSITRPVNKRSTLVKKVTEIREVMREAFALAGAVSRSVFNS